jgi:hypothetical protein
MNAISQMRVSRVRDYQLVEVPVLQAFGPRMIVKVWIFVRLSRSWTAQAIGKSKRTYWNWVVKMFVKVVKE